jgi:hypothetical protein
VVSAAQQLATALKGNIPAGKKTAEALTKVSKLFTKIAAAKQAATAAKEHRIRLRANTTTQITHIPRVDEPLPRVKKPHPRVNKPPSRVKEPSQIMAEPQVEQAPATCSHPLSPQNKAHSSSSWPKYISQDKETNNNPPQRRITQAATQREMANTVIGEGGESLKYKQLIANPKTQATWTHSYGNELGQLAQGMPGLNTGTNTIFYIHKNQVPREQAKDVTYGLITTLV